MRIYPHGSEGPAFEPEKYSFWIKAERLRWGFGGMNAMSNTCKREPELLGCMLTGRLRVMGMTIAAPLAAGARRRLSVCAAAIPMGIRRSAFDGSVAALIHVEAPGQ